MAISRVATSDALAAAQQDITATRSDVAGVKTDVATVLDDVGATRTDVAGVASDVAGVVTVVAGVKSDVAGVKADVDGARVDIAGVQTTLAAIAAAQVPKAFTGQVELFRGPVPAGWTRLSGIAIPAALFNVPRFTLASFTANPGNTTAANATQSAWCVNALGQLHVVGSTTFVHRMYDPGTDAWTQKAASPQGAANQFAMYRSGTKLYQMAAQSSTTALPACYAYDPGTDVWTAVASNPNPKQLARGCTLADGKILLVGGYNSGAAQNASTLVSLVQVYDPVANTWTTKANVPVAMGAVRAVLLSDGRVFVTSPTITTDGSTLNSSSKRCWVYTPTTDTWAEVDPMPAEYNVTYLTAGFFTATTDGKLVSMPGATPSSGAPARVFNPAAAAGSQWTGYQLATVAMTPGSTSVMYASNSDGMVLGNGLVPVMLSASSTYVFALFSLGAAPTYDTDLYYAIKN